MNYSQFGFTNRLRRDTALKSDIVTAVDFESKYEVSSDRVNASKVNLGNFVKISYGGSAVGTFNNYQAFNLTSSITYVTPKSAIPTFGKPVIGIFQGVGTASADQIYPIRGTNVTLGRYDVVGGELDYGDNDGRGYDGVSDQWRGMLIDTNGTSNQTFTFIGNWIFMDYVSGSSV